MFAHILRLCLALVVLMLFVFAGRLTVTWIENAQKTKPKDVLVVGLIDDTPPFCFYSDNNKLVGINIDLVNEMARRIGKRAKIESVSFNRLTTGLMTRQYDIVSIGSITPQRAKVVRYVTPHLISSDVLLVHPKLANLQGIDAFRGRPWRIGVYNGTSYIQLLKDKGMASNMVIYPNQRDVFLAFYKHRVDAIIMNEDVARYIKGHLDPTMVILPERIRKDRKYAFAVRTQDLALWRQVDDTINSMLADGSFARIRSKWLPETTAEKAVH